jgi:hypothetical protein
MRLWKTNGATRILAILAGVGLTAFIVLVAVSFLPYGEITYSNQFEGLALAVPTEQEFQVIHIPTPEPLHAVYMSSWAAGTASFRKHLFDLIDNTEVNAVVIDIKDYTGHISFPVTDPDLQKTGAAERRIPDVKEFIGKLHEKGVYVIGRISSFQDSFLIKDHPEWAVKTKEGNVWQDFKGVKWLDAGATPVWHYLASIGRESYAVGFDELNFDYIRYPSDGNMQDIAYSWSDGRTRQQVMKTFFQFLHEEFASSSIPISADLFGLTTSANDDLGIGQKITDALPYFDYVAPMVYPSHFSHGFIGYEKPAQHPYEVIKYSMEHAIERAGEASTSPSKLRPWLQAFDLGAIYTPELVRAQMQASYDVGLSSWMLWNAASVYNKEALIPKDDSGASHQAGVTIPTSPSSVLP